MSNYPLQADVFVNKTGADNIASSDPNNAFDGIEATQGLIGALGEPQTWSTTLMTLLRRYKRGMYIDVTAGTLTVRSGEAVLESTDGARWVYRRNPADVEVGAGNIDVGTLIATTYYIYAVGGTAASTTPIQFSTDPYAPSAIGTAPYRRIGWFENKAVGSLAITYAGEYDSEVSGKILQIVNTQTGLVGSGTTQIPHDDTAPTYAEGDEYMTIDFTPSLSTSKLKIDVCFNGASSTAGYSIIVALFKDGTGTDECIHAVMQQQTTANYSSIISFSHFMLAGTTSKITFQVRAGAYQAGTTTFNGVSSGGLFNGRSLSSITVTEIAN